MSEFKIHKIAINHDFYFRSKYSITAAHETKLQMILAALEIAESPEELDLPAFSLRPLKGDLKQYFFNDS